MVMHISKKCFMGLKKGVTLIKTMQSSTEEHSLIMSYLAKKIRMSTYTSSTSSLLTLQDHSSATGAPLEFSFTIDSSGKPVLQENGITIADNIDGSFTVIDTASNPIPRVTILLKNPGSIDAAAQTTVSLRSY